VLSPGLLSAAPHLKQLRDQSASDPHLDKTWKLRGRFTAEKTVDQDHFIDVEKLYVSMDVGYDHRDEPTDFVEGYAIVKEDEALAR
jgi:hypothetical protein